MLTVEHSTIAAARNGIIDSHVSGCGGWPERTRTKPGPYIWVTCDRYDEA